MTIQRETQLTEHHRALVSRQLRQLVMPSRCLTQVWWRRGELYRFFLTGMRFRTGGAKKIKGRFSMISDNNWCLAPSIFQFHPFLSMEIHCQTELNLNDRFTAGHTSEGARWWQRLVGHGKLHLGYMKMQGPGQWTRIYQWKLIKMESESQCVYIHTHIYIYIYTIYIYISYINVTCTHCVVCTCGGESGIWGRPSLGHWQKWLGVEASKLLNTFYIHWTIDQQSSLSPLSFFLWISFGTYIFQSPCGCRSGVSHCRYGKHTGPMGSRLPIVNFPSLSVKELKKN